MPNQNKHIEEEFSLKDYFVPFTNTKAIYFIIIVGFIVYFNSLFNGFVWDDLSNILLNQQVRVLNIENIFGKSNINLALQYRPVVALYFSVLYLFFKDVPFSYHLLNLVFHIGNTVLVFFLFKRFFNRYLTFFLSLVFLVHPMQVESVAWIANAGNIYFLFGTIAFLIITKSDITIKKGFTIGILFLLTLLSKETGVLFPVMAGTYNLLKKRGETLRLLFVSVPVFLFYIFLRFTIGQNYIISHSTIIPIARLTLEQRILNIPAIIFYYLKTFLYPSQLVIMQFWTIPTTDFNNFFFPLAIDLLFFVVCGLVSIYLAKKNKKIFTIFIFFLLWFVFGMILNIQLFPLDMTVSDRWFYFPMVGLLGMFGVGLNLLFSKYKHLKLVLCSFGIIILMFFSIRTIARNANWHDDLTLYMHDRKILDNFIIENNIGWNYQHVRDYKNALYYYKRSVELYPYWAISLNNLGHTYQLFNENFLARKYLFKVLEASDYHVEEYNRDLAFAGWLLLQSDSPDIARDFMKKALVKNPTNEFLWAHLAISEYKLKNKDEALKAAYKAITLSPKNEFNYLYYLIYNDKSIPNDINIISQ